MFGSSAVARALPLSLYGGGLGIFLIFVSSILLLVSLVRPQVTEAFRMAVVDVTAPVVEVVSLPFQSAALFLRDVSGLAALQSENVRLKEENLRLREWHQTALMLEAENKSLRDLLHVKMDPQNKFITARVLSDSGRTFAKSLLVSAGTENGVRKGQAVMSASGVIGRVIEAGQKVSRVLLITDINSRVPVLIENSRLHAIFSGTNDDDGRLTHLPQDTTVANGARVITSGHGGIFPYGLPIGVVKNEGNGTITVRPYVDFRRMIYVRIVDRPDDPNLHQGAFGGLSMQ
ncbi:MAG: rod shape-determining protein MreC [Micavibrio sp.]|nr:rod shape-determining protein MreC [Micavibrio sp.]